MLGERIRNLRKQKKMTLEALAGDQLTKGMLSLIENNKAKPSMESLSYIAERLGVETSDLLGEISVQELRDVLEKAETIYNTEIDVIEDKFKQLIDLIDPYLDKLTQGYESARLLDIYSRSLIQEKKNGWQELCERAAKLYDQMNLTAKRASIGMLRSMERFINHDYVESLSLFLTERNEVESNHAYIDPMTQLDLDYHEAILYFAVGDIDSATRVMEQAISFSKEKKMFYLIDDLYRLAAAHAMMTQDDEKEEYYKKKLKQYGEFAEDQHSLFFYELLTIISLIKEKKEYTKAIKLIDEHLSEQHNEFFSPWFFLEKGKALYYLRRYEESIDCLSKITIPSYMHHPFDLSIFYVMDSYKALSYFELGKAEEAFSFASIAVNNFHPLPHSPNKDFSAEVYNQVKTRTRVED